MSDQPIVQWLNSDQVDLLRAWFVDRNEPNYAWKSAVSAVMALPALRAAWPMSSVDYTVASRARDIAGGGYHLTANNVPLFASGQSDALPNMVPFVEFDGVNQSLSRVDGGAANWADVTGTETYVPVAQRGLTFGGWFWLDVLAAESSFIGKFDTTGNQRSYRLFYAFGANTFRFSLSVNGIAVSSVDSTVTPGISQWFFIAGRLEPNAEQSIFVNGVKTDLGAGIASVFDSTAPFEIGARNNNGAALLDGRSSLNWLCAAALSDSIINALYQSTRKAYNV